MRFCRGLHVHHSAYAAVVRVRASSPRLNTAAIQVENGFITPRWIARLAKRRSPNQLDVHETTSKH